MYLRILRDCGAFSSSSSKRPEFLEPQPRLLQRLQLKARNLHRSCRLPHATWFQAGVV